ncbi:hypothetical protein FF38_06561 [Lucilia cuprina]|uniref:Uncharacterized protein n=1 Tax=Lucilia cuprina TaxID=7375 RepID=A0A0L0CD80_LUCCU|nr:hypothetical protein FF38_06561 [Lucilia cuprina]
MYTTSTKALETLLEISPLGELAKSGELAKQHHCILDTLDVPDRILDTEYVLLPNQQSHSSLVVLQRDYFGKRLDSSSTPAKYLRMVPVIANVQKLPPESSLKTKGRCRSGVSAASYLEYVSMGGISSNVFRALIEVVHLAPLIPKHQILQAITTKPSKSIFLVISEQPHHSQCIENGIETLRSLNRCCQRDHDDVDEDDNDDTTTSMGNE